MIPHRSCSAMILKPCLLYNLLESIAVLIVYLRSFAACKFVSIVSSSFAWSIYTGHICQIDLVQVYQCASAVWMTTHLAELQLSLATTITSPSRFLLRWVSMAGVLWLEAKIP